MSCSKANKNKNQTCWFLSPRIEVAGNPFIHNQVSNESAPPLGFHKHKHQISCNWKENRKLVHIYIYNVGTLIHWLNRRIKIDGRSGGFREQAIAKDYATSTLIVSFYENKQKAQLFQPVGSENKILC